MREFPKPVVVVSKCITFEPIRWNGQIIASEFVEKLKPYVNFVPVCPEVEIGLGVPRDPIRIVLVNGEKKLLPKQKSRQKATYSQCSTTRLSSRDFCVETKSQSK